MRSSEGCAENRAADDVKQARPKKVLQCARAVGKFPELAFPVQVSIGTQRWGKTMNELDAAALARIGSGLRNALTVVHLRSAQLHRQAALSHSHRQALESIMLLTHTSWSTLELVLEGLGLVEGSEVHPS
jgi:hypothetical protein